MSVVDGRVDGHGSGGTSVLVSVLVDQSVNEVVAQGGLVHQNVVVDRTSGTLEGVVAAQEEVVLEWVGDTTLHQGTRQGVAVLVALLGEEADVMALGAHNDNELGVVGWISRLEESLHVGNLLLEDVSVLALGDTVAKVDDRLWELAVANNLHPVLNKSLELSVDDVCVDHLHAEAIRLAGSSVAGGQLVDGHGDSGHGRSLHARSAVRHIRTDDHSGHGEDSSGTSSGLADGAAGRTAQLGVELHADVGDVLELSLLSVSVLDALGDNTVAALSRALDATVGLRVLVGQDEHQHLRTRLGGIASLVPGIGDPDTGVVAVGEDHGRVLVLNLATEANVSCE